MIEFDNVSKSFWTGKTRKVILDRANRIALAAIMVDEFTAEEFYNNDSIHTTPYFPSAQIANVKHGEETPVVEKLRVVA